MHTALRETLQQADGRYLDNQELLLLEQYSRSFALRFETYVSLREQSQNLVLQTLRTLIKTHRKTVQEHGPKCQRDMLYTLETISKAILKDDTIGFHEDYLMWMQNITRALHKQDSAIAAYRVLQEQVSATLSPDSAALVNRYLEDMVQSFT